MKKYNIKETDANEKLKIVNNLLHEILNFYKDDVLNSFPKMPDGNTLAFFSMLINMIQVIEIFINILEDNVTKPFSVSYDELNQWKEEL